MKRSNPRSAIRMIPLTRFKGMHRQRGLASVDEDASVFDESKVETLIGTVLSAQHSHSKKGSRSYTVHFLLETGKELMPVHLGPAWYLDRQSVKVSASDRIEVTGSRIRLGEKPAFIAVEVKKGAKVLQLRDRSGAPRWNRLTGGR